MNNQYIYLCLEFENGPNFNKMDTNLLDQTIKAFESVNCFGVDKSLTPTQKYLKSTLLMQKFNKYNAHIGRLILEREYNPDLITLVKIYLNEIEKLGFM